MVLGIVRGDGGRPRRAAHGRGGSRWRRAPDAPLAVLLAGLAAAGCGGGDGEPGPTRLEIWAHAGQEAERTTLEAQARRFDDLHDSLSVEVVFIPEGSYGAQVRASAVAGRLPDLLDLDGPWLASFAWQGHLRPLDGLLHDSIVADLLPSIVRQGTWRGRLYGVGTFDSGLALYGRRSALEAAGARLPSGPSDAWTVAEVDALLAGLAGTDPDGAGLDLKLNYEGEWFAYAFQPALRSGGGALLRWEGDRPVATGALDSRESARVLATLQRWMIGGYVDPNLDDAAFVEGRVALSWSGHWDFPRYASALGEDLAVLPLPNFGEGTRTGQGSWVWAVPSGSARAEAAAAFVSFVLRPDEVLTMTAANGAVPGTRAAAQGSERYGPGGALRLLLEQLEGEWAVPRPRTPAYPFVSSVFQDVFDAVRNGEDPVTVLGEAAAMIDREIEDNQGYPFR